MKITLRQLRVFDAVASLGSIAKAAAALGITQSTASASLKELQATMARPPLFHRAGRNLRITPEGLRLQPVVRSLLSQAEEIERPSENATLSGTLRIGAGENGETLVPALAAGFRKLHPGVRIDMVFGHTFEVVQFLSSLAIDCVITSSLTRAPGAHLTEIFRDRSVIVAHPDDPLAALPRPGFADLLDVEWCMPVRTTLSNQRMMEALRGHVANYRVALESNSDVALREAVRAGAGIACLPFSVVEAALAASSLVELKIDGFAAERPTFLVRMANVERSATARAFDDYVVKAFGGTG